MLCAKLATRRDGVSFPCGQCTNCRINHRRYWQARLLLEAATHDYGIFVTLTFRDTGVMPILRRSDVRSFLRSLREACCFEVRYFAAAEYGTKGGRAHYHFHLFSNRPLTDKHLSQAWPFGHIHVGETEPSSLDYTLGYLLKDRKITRWPVEIRYPEFRSFSKGIGKKAFSELAVSGVLPRQFRVYGRLWPVGRYFRSLAQQRGVQVDDTDTAKAEKFEADHMRRVLARPDLSASEVAKLYDDYTSHRQEKQKVARSKAIRAAYLEMHGHSLRKKDNETF